MGLGGISIWQLVIILMIVIMLFGTKRLKTLGTDVGETIKGFRKSMASDENKPVDPQGERLEGDIAHVRQAESKH